MGRFLPAQSRTLWAGFSGLVLMLGFLSWDASRSMRASAAATRELREESRARDNLLDQLRADIYRSAAVGHDFVLGWEGDGAASQVAELERLRGRIGTLLDRYETKLPDNERQGFADMRRQVERFWKAVTPALRWTADEREANGEQLLRKEILPFRNSVVALSEQIAGMNERDLDAGEVRIREVQAQAAERMAIVSVVTLSFGLLLAVVTVRRVRRLEEEAMLRFTEVEAARRELRALSVRLVSAQEEERRRLSRELHDEVGQSMSAMLVELGRAETAADGEGRRESLGLVRRMAEETVGMVRNMALLLRPSMLDDLGLVAALRWQAREVTRRSGMKVKMVADEVGEELSDGQRTCVYRVVQEALHNCAKHSQATEVRVVVYQDGEGLSVIVQDNGMGFEPRKEKGMGLLGMEERVVQLAGQFAIESTPGEGTVLRVTLPIARAAG